MTNVKSEIAVCVRDRSEKPGVKRGLVVNSPTEERGNAQMKLKMKS